MAKHLLAMYKSFDIESKGRADALDVLAVEFLQNRGLACIIESPSHIYNHAFSTAY